METATKTKVKIHKVNRAKSKNQKPVVGVEGGVESGVENAIVELGEQVEQPLELAVNLAHYPDMKAKITDGGIALVDPEDIVVDPQLAGRMFKRSSKKFEELKRSIMEVGQLEPCAVMLDSGGRAILLAGFGRYEAITQINESGKDSIKLKVFLWDDVANVEQGFLHGAIGNIKR